MLHKGYVMQIFFLLLLISFIYAVLLLLLYYFKHLSHKIYSLFYIFSFIF